MTNPVVYVLKGLLAVFLTLGSTFVMTPIWLFRSVTRKSTSKECPNALQNYMTMIARNFIYWLAVIGTQPSINTRTPSRLRDWILCRSFQWVKPAPVGVFTGNGDAEKAEKYCFDTTKLPLDLEEKEISKQTAALWFFNPAEKAVLPIKSARKSSVLLYFHGGAYIALEAGDIFVGLTLARMEAKHARIDVFSVNYRLAPASKHPSQIFEAYSAYVHLRELGYDDIFIGGDSAGANLALALWYYLHEVVNASDSVIGLVLHSPWLCVEARDNFATLSPNCVVSAAFINNGYKAMQRSNLPSPQDPWMSPLSWSTETFKSLPPMFVTNGGIETIKDEGCEFVALAKAQGVQVEHIIMDGHPHDFSAMFWFYPSGKKIFKRLGEWVLLKQPKDQA